MTLFADREHAFEEMFAHDEEARFRALARRNRLLGQWAAARLRLTGAQAEIYAQELGTNLAGASVDEILIRRIHADFQADDAGCSEDEIRHEMAKLMETAVAEVRTKPW